MAMSLSIDLCALREASCSSEFLLLVFKTLDSWF